MCFFDLDTGLGKALRINDCPYKILDELFDGELVMEKHFDSYIDRCIYEEDQELGYSRYLMRELTPSGVVLPACVFVLHIIFV